MRDHDCGVRPVRKDDRLVGAITDRDIAVRVVAEGKPVNKCTVAEVMTREKPLVGIVALAILAPATRRAGRWQRA